MRKSNIMTIFGVHEPCQWIQICIRHMQRNRTLMLITVILSTCFLGVILLTVHNNEYRKDVKKSGCVFERDQESLQRCIGLIRKTSQGSTEKIKNINPVMLDDSIPLLTLFTSWVDRKDKYVVQNRTVVNWMSFWPHICPVIFTNDITLASQCKHRGWNALPLKHTAAEGVPILRYMYLDAMRLFDSVFYGFSNSDILFNEGLIKTLITVKEFIQLNQVSVLITGRRTNVDYKVPCNASDWRNITTVSKIGELVEPFSADYFITTKHYPWENIDDIIIGRMRVDNWIIQFSQLKNITVIDSTPTILAMHQTTETGNAEGESKENKFYNDDILRKVRNIVINVNRGRTDCAKYVTNLTTSGLVQLVKQTPQSICNSDNSSNAAKGTFNISLIKILHCVFLMIIYK